MMGCRAKNVGWRLDYFLVSKRLLPRLEQSVIRDQVQPVELQCSHRFEYFLGPTCKC
jgi:exonuclease III